MRTRRSSPTLNPIRPVRTGGHAHAAEEQIQSQNLSEERRHDGDSRGGRRPQRRCAAARTDPASGPRPLDDYDFDEVYDRVGTDSVRWDRAVEQFGPGIVAGMGVADMDFRAAPCVTNALAERCTHENWGYMARPASYAEAVAEWNNRRYGLDIDPSTIVFTTGVHPGIIAALHTFSPPGGRVLLQSPTYAGFYSDLRFTRTVADDSPMVVAADGSYSIDFDDFERARPAMQHLHPVQPAKPHRQLLVRRRHDAHG